jgi:predicted MFS family arabinose efflux permease
MIGGSGYFAGSLLAGRLLAHWPARPLIGITSTALAIAVLVMYGFVQHSTLAVALIVLAAFAGGRARSPR